MFTVNSMISKTSTSKGWYYGNNTVKQTIQKNTNNEFPNSPQPDSSFLSTVKSQAMNNEYNTFIERNDSVIIHNTNSTINNRRSQLQNFSNGIDDDEFDDANCTYKKKSEKENIDELVEKSKLMNISNKKNQFNTDNNGKIITKSNNGSNNASLGNKSYMEECEEDFPTVRKRPANVQPDLEVLNSIETVYEMVFFSFILLLIY